MRNIRLTASRLFALALFSCGGRANQPKDASVGSLETGSDSEDSGGAAGDASGADSGVGNQVIAWTRTAHWNYWTSVASSSDGAKLVAAAGDLLNIDYVYTSVDSGATWTQTGTAQAWTSVASSADGTKLVAASEGGGIYTSVDSGATWTQTGTREGWTSVASSADGTKLVAVSRYVYAASSGYTDGHIYTSVDSGATWTQTGTAQACTSVASSADGTKLVASSSSYIYTSVDSGATWTQTGTAQGWTSVVSSADGTKLVAGFTLPTRTSSGYLPAGGYLCTSADSGAAWTQTGPDVGWMSVASSADGSKLVAAGAGAFADPDGISGYSDDYLYTSTDSGVTWNQTAVLDGWRSVASSADGTKLVAAVYFGYIYTGSRPAP